MSIAGSKQFVATAFEGTLELWTPGRDIRITHTLPPEVRIRKVECNHQGGIALTDTGQVIFFDHRRTYPEYHEQITDISASERGMVMTTATGNFIILGRKGRKLEPMPPPLNISVGSARIAVISNGRLYIDHTLIPHTLPIVQVSVGGGHTVFLDSSGAVYGFGHNSKGQLGQAGTHFETPVRVPLTLPVRKVVAGTEHTVLLDQDYNLWVCGSNQQNQLGQEIGNAAIQVTPICSRIEVLDVAARGHMTYVLFLNGDLELLGTR